MKITCIGCLHGHYPKLDGGDLLIVTGDLTARDTQEEHMRFLSWIAQTDYKKKIWIAGNHDNYLVGTKFIPIKDLGLEYLCDSGTEFEGLKIYGSPWTKIFNGMNKKCMAFTFDTEEELESKWAMIPDDIDILVTHGPPYGMKDRTIRNECVGSKSLQMEIFNRLSPKLLVFSHIHEDYGKAMPGLIDGCEVVNCSHVNERYEPVNQPVRVVL